MNTKEICTAETLTRIRDAERDSHLKAYANMSLFEKGTWLEKPIKAVTDLFPYLDQHSKLRILDLGSGIGRNSIPIAQRYPDCKIECVDILDYAVKKLDDYSIKYQVKENIEGIVMPLEKYVIRADSYDLIMAVSALEHIDRKNSFFKKLSEIRDGVREGGFVCLVMNSEVTENDKETGKMLQPQFEVNLTTEHMKRTLCEIFDGWNFFKFIVSSQHYDIPRENCVAELRTNVVTLVARKAVRES